MFSDLKLFKMAYAMASHAGQRQAIVAQNIANADTPGYRSRDIAVFTESYRNSPPQTMHTTRSGHITADRAETGWREIETQMPTDPNNNSVSVELEMVKGVEIKSQHDRALAIYRSGLNILRTSLGRG